MPFDYDFLLCSAGSVHFKQHLMEHVVMLLHEEVIKAAILAVLLQH